ncbi:NADH dehydrogenase [ubiquinone] 1 alpha subcomplex assembly factor 5 [Armadillidium vulgare]|nr:NADH dehydrogenase [ubiquinone] 1 alpha subcomplex assembly factor 5 [Armadillidium vulgare]
MLLYSTKVFQRSFCNLKVFVCSTHSFCTSTLSRNLVEVFDRNAKFLQRERSASMEDHKVFDYIKEEVGYRLADRILDIKKDFGEGLDLGCGKGFVSRHIMDVSLKKLHMGELSPSLLKLAEVPEGIEIKKQVMDEESQLPFDKNALDIVISNLRTGLLGLPSIANREFKEVFPCKELFSISGFASHVSPFTEIRDIGGLLNQAGFTLLTIDTDEITIRYPTLFELMWDLKGMGESNASLNRKLHLHRDTMMAAAAIYQEMYGTEDTIPATFQIIYMIGWKPDPKKAVSQSERGSAQVSFKDIERLNELIKEHGMEGRVKFMKEEETKSHDPKKKK